SATNSCTYTFSLTNVEGELMMAISQAKRTELHQELREKLTVDTADTLMDHLPPDGWSEVAMKSDLRTLEVAMKSDLHTLEVAMKSDLTSLEVALRSEMKAIEHALKSDIAALQAAILLMEERINSKIATLIAKQNKWMTGVLASLVVAMIIALMR
ncbi:MAG: hypothetical protein RLZ18_1565, partial [Actinomycetota bacterium]